MATNDERIVTLNVQEDFAEKLATGRPVQAIAELIWNGLDAESTSIKVTAEEGQIGLESVTVQDNGHGMTYEEGIGFFENLGGLLEEGKQFIEERSATSPREGRARPTEGSRPRKGC